ncbi:MAG: hypothetical protein AAGD25_36935 [Cyanobacteria bacterium P01_F01_bin.150]
MTDKSKNSPSNNPRNSSLSGKSLYLVASLIGWMLVGGALIYLAPVLANRLFHSATTEVWMETLVKSGYNPMISVVGGGIALVVTVTGQLIWAPKFGQTR